MWVKSHTYLFHAHIISVVNRQISVFPIQDKGDLYEAAKSFRYGSIAASFTVYFELNRT